MLEAEIREGQLAARWRWRCALINVALPLLVEVIQMAREDNRCF